MKQNLGSWDRRLRIVLGVVIIAVSIYYHSWWAILGIGLLVNGLMGFCGVYALLGISTCKVKPDK